MELVDNPWPTPGTHRAAELIGLAGREGRLSTLAEEPDRGPGIAVGAQHESQFVAEDWSDVSTFSWVSLVLSALLALNVAYLIWYTGVQRLGAARTSIYSNLVPIVAMTFAWFWLGEPLTQTKVIGALAVMTGVLLTRLGRRPQIVPVEE